MTAPQDEQRPGENEPHPSAGLSFDQFVDPHTYNPKPQASKNQPASKEKDDRNGFNWDKFEALTQFSLALLTLALLGLEGWFLYRQIAVMQDSVNKQAEAIRQTNTAIGQTKSLIEQQDKTLGYTKTQTDATVNSANAAQDAIRQSRESFQQGQRPYIWLTNNLGKPECVRVANTPDAPNCYVVWDWRFTNYGQSPAYNIRFTHSLIIGDNLLRKPRVFEPTKPAAPLPPNKEDFSTALWPTRITPERFAQLMDTEESIMVFGRIDYSDAQAGRYETGFCFYRLRTGAVAYCSTGNYIH